MSEKKIVKETTTLKKVREIKVVKGEMTVKKGRFDQKVIHHQAEIKDPLKPHFWTSMQVYIPKLRPTQLKPVIMMYFKNGRGRCFFRCHSPDELAGWLRYYAELITTDPGWVDAWDATVQTSESLIVDPESVMEDRLMDINEFTLAKDAEKKYKQKTHKLTKEEKDLDKWM